MYDRTLPVLAIAAVLGFVSDNQPSVAAPGEAPPAELREVGVDEKLNAQLPLDLTFRNERGQTVTLRQLFARGKPVILSLNYSNCPMLCSLQLNGLVDSLRQMAWTPGHEFEVVSVSIDPLETPERAALAKQKYVQAYARRGSSGGWHFLTGQQTAIRRLADAVGFRYHYIRERREYAHAAVFMICTPEGRVSRYMYGIEFPEQTLKLSLVEAAEGRIGTTLDQILLFCFHYDSVAGRYTPHATNLMRAAGLLTLALLGGVLFTYWRRECRRSQRSLPDGWPRDTQKYLHQP